MQVLKLHMVLLFLLGSLGASAGTPDTSSDVCTWHDKDGQRHELHLQNGVKHGPYMIWDADDNLVQMGFYSMNEKDASWKQYNSNGDLIAEIQYVEGKRHGAWRFFHANGHLRAEIFYDSNEPIGHWSSFNERQELMEYAYHE